ncbi:DVU0298 family protein [Thermodesulfobacteriota bacterium]
MIENKFLGRDVVKRPECPFCGIIVERPRELDTRRPGEMPLGSCSCGAVYSCDETGHNVGSAIIEALVFACDMDWDLAWDLLPEEDYSHEIVENYDYQSNLIIPGGFYESRRISGVLLFVRLHEDVQELTSEGVNKKLKRTKEKISVSPSETKQRVKKKSLSKTAIEKYVKEYNFESILEAAGSDKKIIRNLKRLLYSGDDLFRKRAAEAMGRACAIIGDDNPGIVSRLLASLFYSITDTAAFTWGAFEAIGEIISHRAELYAGYIPQLYQFLGDETRRASVLETVGRIALARPDLIRKHTFHFFSFLNDDNPQVKGYTIWLLGNLGAHEAREDIEKFMDEQHEISIYEEGNLVVKKIGQVSSEALSKLST